MCKDKRPLSHHCGLLDSARPLVDDPDDEDYEDDYSGDGDDGDVTELEEPEVTADELAGIRQRATMVAMAKRAVDIVTGSRNKSYGNPYDNHKCSADMWNTFLHRRGLMPADKNMTATDHCVMMGNLLKASRQAHWSQEDNFLDNIGYALNGWACHVEEEYRIANGIPL